MDLFDILTEQDEKELAAAGWVKLKGPYWRPPDRGCIVVGNSEAYAALDKLRREKARRADEEEALPADG